MSYLGVGLMFINLGFMLGIGDFYVLSVLGFFSGVILVTLSDE